MANPDAGIPPGVTTAMGQDISLQLPSTSHISIVDSEGNAVSMTTTIESGFGSLQLVNGYLLNNELTDYSFSPTDDDGNPIANRVQAGKLTGIWISRSLSTCLTSAPATRPMYDSRQVASMSIR